jgi:prepilin-type N-terminal cleavage/methylation domain-containing protein
MRGFSLVELSIVLVILGLLTGGILTGQSLIRASELRSLGTQATNVETSLQSFRDKYFAIPGDMRNAVRFWGAQAGVTTDGVDATCAALTTPATTAATCNGNGDGIIGDGWPIVPHEHFRVWQHLANAGLIEGNYAGVPIGTGSGNAIGRNIPQTKLSNVGAAFHWIPSSAGVTYYFPSVRDTIALVFAAVDSSNFLSAPILRPEEQWNIDTKYDDGRPGTGKIFARGTIPACSAPDNDPNATYQLTNNSLFCVLRWRIR